MNELLSPVAKTIQERFSGQVSEFRGDVSILVPVENIIASATALRDDFDFDMLSAETAVDYCPQTHPRFHIVYIFYSSKTKLYLTLRTPVDGEDPKVPTMETVYPNANWREREIWDLMGIRFEGHSDLRRIVLPPNWQGHPLRKDYPLGYEEVEFTFDFKDIDLRKPKGVR